MKLASHQITGGCSKELVDRRGTAARMTYKEKKEEKLTAAVFGKPFICFHFATPWIRSYCFFENPRDGKSRSSLTLSKDLVSLLEE